MKFCLNYQDKYQREKNHALFHILPGYAMVKMPAPFEELTPLVLSSTVTTVLVPTVKNSKAFFINHGEGFGSEHCSIDIITSNKLKSILSLNAA